MWRRAFFLSSLIATFAQGMVLGTYLEGIPIDQAGSLFYWLRPFPFVVGLGLVCGYALIGACWLLLAVLVFIAALAIWTPLMQQRVFD